MLHLHLIILTKGVQCWCHWHHMTKSHVASHFDHLDLINEMMPLMTLLTSCVPGISMALHDPRSYVAHYLNCLNLMKIMGYWQCHWHHMMLMPVPTVSNDWKSDFASHFDHLELTNAVVLLMMPPVPWNANTGITWPKKVMLHFVSIILTQQTNWCYLQCHQCPVMLALVLTTSCDQRDSCLTLFQMSSPNEENGAIDDVGASHGSNAGTYGTT